MSPRRVLVLGGYGLIGQSVVYHLLEAGHSVAALGRDVRLGARREPRCAWIHADIAALTSAADWMDMLGGMDAVVNASGALQTGLKDRLQDVQNRAIIALIEACETSGVRSFVQISAPGAREDASTEFLRTKSVADARLRTSALDWVILKPGLVISPNAYGGTALIRMLAAFPAVLPLVHADAKVGTIDIHDVSAAVVMAVEQKIRPRTELAMIEAEPMSLKEVALTFRAWLGLSPPVAVILFPRWVAVLVGKASDALGRLGWRSPLRSTALEIILGGVTAETAGYTALFGQPPRPLAETLRRMPATVQERWFARMYLAMPLIVATLSFFWMVSGVMGLLQAEDAASHLVRAGLGNAPALVVVILGAFIDIALGLAVLFQPLARKALMAMAAVTVCYLAAGTILSPQLWLDPLGPYVKTIPAAVLALIATSLMESR